MPRPVHTHDFTSHALNELHQHHNHASHEDCGADHKAEALLAGLLAIATGVERVAEQVAALNEHHAKKNKLKVAR